MTSATTDVTGRADAPAPGRDLTLSAPLIRAIAAATAVVLIQTVVYYLLIRHQDGGFGDLLGRASNFASLKTTGNIYTDFSIEAFTYPPGGILLLSPLVLVPSSLLAPLWTFGVLGSLAGSIFIGLRFLTRLSTPHALVVAVGATLVAPVALSAVYDNIFWGQIGTMLTLAILADFLVMRAPAQGVWVGLATALKIYPGIFIVIWLVRRQYRPALTALVTVATTTAIATVFYFHSATTFFRQQIEGSQELQHFATYSTAEASSSIVDVFLRPPYFLGHLTPRESLAIAAIFVVIGVVASYGAWARGHEFTAVIIGLIISTICSPIAWNHYFSFIPLLLLVPLELGWRSWTARVAYLAVAINMVPWPRYKLVGVVQVLLDHFHLYLAYVAQSATMVSMLLVMLVAALEFRPRSLRLPRLRARREKRTSLDADPSTPVASL